MALITVQNDADVIDFQLELILSQVFENDSKLQLGSEFRNELKSYTQDLRLVYTTEKYKGLFGVDKVLHERSLARYLLQDFLEGKVSDYFVSKTHEIMGLAEKYGLRARALDLALAVSLMDTAVAEGVLEYRVKDYKTREVVLKDN